MAWLTTAGVEPAAGRRALRRPGPLTVVLALAALAQAALVTSEPQLGNGDYYLRNADVLASGSLPHSRYSPGFPLLLAPLAALLPDQSDLLLAVSLLTAVLAVVALWLTARVLTPWVGRSRAVVAVAVLALGQTGIAFLGHGEVEALALALVCGVLLALQHDRPVLAAVLTTAALLVRVPLAPFLGLLWLLHLRRHPLAASLAALGAALAAVAQRLTAPLQEQDYLQIGRLSYEDASDGLSPTVLLGGVLDRAWDYATVGVPRFLLPAAVVLPPPGRLLGLAVTCVAVVGGVLLLARRQDDRLRCCCVLALVAQVVALTLWPVRAPDTTRMLLPLAPVVLAVLVCGAGRLLPRRALLPLVAGLVALGLAATGSFVWQTRTPPPDAAAFVAAHREAARGPLPLGAVISRKPGYSELALGRPGREFPLGVEVAGLEAYAADVGACLVVVDGLDGGLSPALSDWVRAHDVAVLAERGATSIHLLARCRR